MSVTRIASRYAKSLMDLALEQGTLDRILADVNSLKDSMSNRDLFLMLKSPIINAGKKKDILKAIFGASFDQSTMTFMDIVVGKGRESILPEIADEFLELYRQHKNITNVKVTSAQPLSEDALNKIKSKLTASDLTTSEVEIETSVDPSLIGGFVIEIGDKLYDSSVAHKLNLARKEFTNN